MKHGAKVLRAVGESGAVCARGLLSDIMVDVPARLLWDYDAAPEDELWRLQRIIDFFPQYGRQRETVRDLLRRLDELRAPPEVKELIRVYARRYGMLLP